MTGLSGCGDVRLALGVYVVGAIDPAERAIVDAHLSHCVACREELAGLAGLPALLGRVPARDVERLAASGTGPGGLEEPPPELLSSLLGRVAARRRARRWRTITMAAAAAVIAVAGGLAGGAAISGDFSSSPPVAGQSPPVVARHHYQRYQATDPLTHVTAVVAYSPAAWGTSLRVRVSGVRAGTTCEFWVENAQGQRSVAGGWTVARGDRDQWYMVSTPVSGAKIHSFQVTAAGRVLVTVPA
jgi:anti-sigma factor RsiW